jgi:hypothetical protein
VRRTAHSGESGCEAVLCDRQGGIDHERQA